MTILEPPYWLFLFFFDATHDFNELTDFREKAVRRCASGVQAAQQLQQQQPNCSISVAFSGTPRDGQIVAGANGYAPITNTLGMYSTVGSDRAPSDQGWFFAVQVQANLFGGP